MRNANWKWPLAGPFLCVRIGGDDEDMDSRMHQVGSASNSGRTADIELGWLWAICGIEVTEALPQSIVLVHGRYNR